MTTLFSDSFVDGTANAWTGSTGTAPTVQSGSALDGDGYGISSSHVTGSDYYWKYLATGYSTAYYQALVRFAAMPPLYGQNNFMQIKDTGDANAVIVGIVNQGSGYRWWITLGGNNYAADQTDPVIAENTTYRVELRRTVGSGTGIVTVWVNGTQVYTKTDCTLANNAAYFELGTIYADGTTQKDLDAAKVADAYIGLPMSQVPTPTFDPAAGTYTSVQYVTLDCTQGTATIYYTTDGSTPDSGDTEYSTAITVASTTTIKAIAVEAGHTDSNVASATYTINLTYTLTVNSTPIIGVPFTIT